MSAEDQACKARRKSKRKQILQYIKWKIRKLKKLKPGTNPNQRINALKGRRVEQRERCKNLNKNFKHWKKIKNTMNIMK